MKAYLFAKGCVSYGAAVLSGKAVAVVLAMLMALPVAAGQVTVTALGDSLTQGYGLPEGEGFVPQMQAWLEAQGADVMLINAGVSGDTTAGGAARLAWALADKPQAMIVTLGGNDMLRGIDPVVARGNLEAILLAAREAEVAVMLVGMKAPQNYGADYKVQFDALYGDLAAEYNALFYDNFFAGLEADTQDAARAFMQADGIHPNAKGVRRIVAAMGPAVVALIARVDGSGS